MGWSEPNRSHFKASDQWATGSPQGEGAGWLAEAVDRHRRQGSLVALGPFGSPALEGGGRVVVPMAPGLRPDQRRTLLDPDRAGPNSVLRRMLELEEEGLGELERLLAALPPLPKGLGLPRGGLGPQVALALRLIGSEACPAVIALAHGGYDTHANQKKRHQRQLTHLGNALAGFERGLERLPHRPRVTLLTTSEFGRRLRTNGSGGTDHGSASISLLLGDQVPHPFLGSYPSLRDLDGRGDLVPSLSPPQLYEQVMML